MSGNVGSVLCPQEEEVGRSICIIPYSFAYAKGRSPTLENGRSRSVEVGVPHCETAIGGIKDNAFIGLIRRPEALMHSKDGQTLASKSRIAIVYSTLVPILRGS